MENSLKVLNADQKKAYEELTGKPFQVQFGGRRPGGPGKPPRVDF
jgi:hypothetical protein